MNVKYLKRTPNGWFSYRRRIPKNLQYLFNGEREFKVSLKTKDEEQAVIQSYEHTRVFNAKIKQHKQTMEAVGEDSSKALPSAILNKGQLLAKQYGVHPSQRPVLEAGATKQEIEFFKIEEASWLQKQDIALDVYHESLVDYDQMDKDYKDGVWGSEGYETPSKKPDVRDPNTIALMIAMGKYEVKPEANIQNVLDTYIDVQTPRDNQNAIRNDRQQKKLVNSATSAFEKVFSAFPQGMNTLLSDLDKGMFRQSIRELWPNAGTRKRNIAIFKGAFNTWNRESDPQLSLDYFDELVTKSEIKRDKRERRSFTPDELKLFLLSVHEKETYEVKLFISLMHETGARNSEVSGLLMNDVKLEAEVPHVKFRTNSLRIMGKDGLERSVPLTDRLFDMIKTFRFDNDTDEKLFPYWGVQSRGDDLSKRVSKHIQNLRPSDNRLLEPYSLRHTFIDKLDAAITPTSVAEYMTGHKSEPSSRVHKTYGTGVPPKNHKEYVIKANEIANWGYFE